MSASCTFSCSVLRWWKSPQMHRITEIYHQSFDPSAFVFSDRTHLESRVPAFTVGALPCLNPWRTGIYQAESEPGQTRVSNGRVRSLTVWSEEPKSFNTFYHKQLVPSYLQPTHIKHYEEQQNSDTGEQTRWRHITLLSCSYCLMIESNHWRV